jgi:hypothetical protein
VPKAGLGLVLVVLLVSTPGGAGERDRLCTPLPQYDRLVVPDIVDSARADAEPITLPVVVRLMHKRGGPDTVAEKVTLEFLDDVLGAGGRVNAIWHKAGIQVKLALVEGCDYAPGTLRKDGASEDVMPWPDATYGPRSEFSGRELYRDVLRRYNPPERRTVNVYIWSALTGSLNGAYGTAPLGDDPLAAIWTDVSCADPQLITDCGLLIAHELGHFLTLEHLCRRGMDPDTTLPRCRDQSDDPGNEDPTHGLLMRAKEYGEHFRPSQPDEIRLAQEAARKLLGQP